MIQGSIVGCGKRFFLVQIVQAGSGTHLASYSMTTLGCFPQSKVARAWSWPVTST